jgi:hypothetical protein
MTCQTLRSSATPKALTGWVLLDDNNLPRYWATVWADVLQAKLKDSTRSRCLYAIDRLYQHFALLHQADVLDQLLTDCQFDALEAGLTAFLSVLRNQAKRDGIVNSTVWASAIRPARSWILTGDCDYLHFIDELKPLPPVGMVAPHHGADLDSNSPIPKPPSNVNYKRLAYSFGPGNKHGRNAVQHPTPQGVMLHNGADWDHNHWSLVTPGFTTPGGDILATCEHAPGTSRGGALIGWSKPPMGLHAPCGGWKCSAPINQS